MTTKDLAKDIYALIGEHLGKYQRKNAREEPAFSWQGEPRKDLTVQGLECILSPEPELDSKALQNHQHVLGKSYSVRLVVHGYGELQIAVETLLNAYKGSSIQYVPGDEGLGILRQCVITLEF
jgi:hypothetical protein